VVTGLRAAAHWGPALVGDLPDRIELQPGELRTFSLRLHWQPKPWVVPFHDEKETTDGLTVTGQVSSPWGASLGPDISLDTPRSIRASGPRLTATTEVGTWLAQAGTAAAVVVLIGIGSMLFYRRRRAVQSGTLVALSPMTGEELGRFRLSGRTTRMAGQRLPGEGVVVARRVPTQLNNADGIEYVIRYRRMERVHTSSLPSRGSVLISGVAFEHVPA
jgi:hypothetical protein